MKIILDECLPRRLLRDMSDYIATTVPRQGWAGITNGALLKRSLFGSYAVIILISGCVGWLH